MSFLLIPAAASALGISGTVGTGLLHAGLSGAMGAGLAGLTGHDPKRAALMGAGTGGLGSVLSSLLPAASSAAPAVAAAEPAKWSAMTASQPFWKDALKGTANNVLTSGVMRGLTPSQTTTTPQPFEWLKPPPLNFGNVKFNN